MRVTGLYLTAPPAGRHGKHGTFPRQFHVSSRSKDYGDGKLCPLPEQCVCNCSIYNKGKQ